MNLPAEKTTQHKKNNSAILKLGILIMLRDGYTYRKSKKKILKSEEEEKDNFYFKFVSKITDGVTQK